MQKRQLVIVTDCTDIAAVEIQLAISRELPSNDAEAIPLVGPIAPVAPLSLTNAAFITRLVAEALPPQSIILVVVSPLHGSIRRVAGRTIKKQITFLGRDTGVFHWLTQDLGCDELYEFDREYQPFGGKHIWPAVVSEVLREGVPENSRPVHSPEVQTFPLQLGTIVHIDNFGIAKMWNPALGAQIEQSMQSRTMEMRNSAGVTFQARIVTRLTEGRSGEWVIYRGSSLGLPELAQTRGPGAPSIGLKIGDILLPRS